MVIICFYSQSEQVLSLFKDKRQVLLHPVQRWGSAVLGMGLGVGMVAKKSNPRVTVSLVYLKQKQEQRIIK